MQDIRYIWIWRDRLNFRPCPVVARARAHISEQRFVIKPSHSVAHLRVTSCGSLILLKRPCSWFLAVRDSSLGFWDSFFVVLRNHARKNISPCLSSKLTILILFMRMTLSTLPAYPSSMRDACHMKTCHGPASLPFKNLWLSDWASLPSSQFTKFLISFRFCSCWSRHFQLPGLLSFWLCVWVSEEWAVHLIQLPRGKSSTSRMWIKQSR